MTTQGNPAGAAAGNAQGGHEASGKHQGLHQPDNDERVEDALQNVDLQDRGATLDDHLRDKHSKGVRDGYDDSIDHDAAADEA